MKKELSNGMKRIITGILLSLLLIFIVVFTKIFWFFAAVALIVGLSLIEYYKITAGQDKGLLIIGTLFGVMIPVVVYLAGLKGVLGYLTFVVFLVFIYYLFIHEPLATVTSRIGVGILGIIYIAFFISHLILIRDLEQGSLWILFLVFIIAANDTFAYYVGKKYGRRKLSPIVSPNKTVEGAVGGFVGGLLIAIAFQQLFLLKITLIEAITLSAFIGIIGQFSDLFESLIKRSADVKDSGSILPGHGGVLDRIDSIIFPAPFLYYYIIIFKV